MHQWYSMISVHQCASVGIIVSLIKINQWSRQQSIIDANLLFPKGLYGPLNCLSHHKYLNPNEGPLPAKNPFYFFPTGQVHKQQSFDLRVVTLVVPRDFRTWLTKALPLHGGQIGDGESGWRSRCQSLYPTQNSWVPWALCVQGSPGKRKQRVPMHYALGANTHPWISSKANVDPYVQPDISWEPKPAEILGFEKYLSFSDKTQGILTHSESTG